MSFIKGLYLFLRYYTLGMVMCVLVPYHHTVLFTPFILQIRYCRYAPVLHDSTFILSR